MKSRGTKISFSNEECVELSNQLLDTGNPIPEIEYFQNKSMDFSLESLKLLDIYLGRQNIDEISIAQCINITLRCGSYLGEVIRQNSDIPYNWIGYACATEINEKIRTIDFGFESTYMMYSADGRFVFPFSKVVNRMRFGLEENIGLFAKIAISGT